MRTFILAAAILFSASLFNTSTVQAETFPVIKDQTVLTECTECHMAFPPETLSTVAWTKIINGLEDHYGEDASLDAATTAIILDYHLKNANDVTNTRAANKWRMSFPVMRIIDASRFIKKHKGCEAAWVHKDVGSKANCLSCHKDMQTTGSTKENISFLPASIRRTCGED
ncbi:MAG: hypothetical protein COB59_06115 [Rhodospirillaceae bacterium]|nr:MAG: hypothetical protein COB59_06115 [Rhodospirillaceae bacterium]